MSVLKERDPLLDGPGKETTVWMPLALKEALKREAKYDGYSLSRYAVELLAFAVRARQEERRALDAVKAKT
jgi:hypothetical protein